MFRNNKYKTDTSPGRTINIPSWSHSYSVLCVFFLILCFCKAEQEDAAKDALFESLVLSGLQTYQNNWRFVQRNVSVKGLHVWNINWDRSVGQTTNKDDYQAATAAAAAVQEAARPHPRRRGFQGWLRINTSSSLLTSCSTPTRSSIFHCAFPPCSAPPTPSASQPGLSSVDTDTKVSAL